ncbi:sensor histidine kinase [Candidatus Frankia meridionalis]|uniref:histidine kinase n=1 Tax=Candidatus Protofrankia datiscae TaxID=2716812 RepID=F8AZV2_9ACTN|nr:PAS/PAC sensor signal transduction histidine kinase [Candidatus Protofrankia datiscae]
MTHTVTSAPDQARRPEVDGDALPAPGPRADGVARREAATAQPPPVLPMNWDDLPDGIVIVDREGRIEVFNAAAARITGVSAATTPGQHLTEVLPLLDERGNDWWECSRVTRGLPRVTGQPERRLTLARQGDERDLNVTVRYVRVDGQLAHVSLSLRDTASRERMERNRADLVSTVAHELRSPLTSVKGFTATLLAKWDRFTEEQKKLMLNTVNTDADRVTRLLAEVLDVSRIDSGRIQMRKQIVDLGQTLRRVVDGKVAAGEATHDRFVVRAEGELPEMWLDSDKIEQVLHNLVDNALRHGAGTVTIVMRGTPSGAEVTVADEGDGVPEASASRVFTKFWRGATRGNGTGLGLYIARALIEAHGGSITVGRAPGGGAEFRFVVPAGAPVFA